MKTTILEARGALFDLTQEIKHGYAVLVRHGKPVAYLLSTSHYDEEDIQYMRDPQFWEMIRERRKSDDMIPLEQIEADIAKREQRLKKNPVKDPMVPLAEVKRRLKIREQSEARIRSRSDSSRPRK